jgi:hypothetical protein
MFMVLPFYDDAELSEEVRVRCERIDAAGGIDRALDDLEAARSDLDTVRADMAATRVTYLETLNDLLRAQDEIKSLKCRLAKYE